MLTPVENLVPKLIYRKATEKDLIWINERYETVNFKPSSLDAGDEEIWISESMGRPVGVGRLVDMGSGTVEMGGMYVLDRFRGHGIARKLVDLLMDSARARFETIYCIPVNHLVDFYKGFGFELYSGKVEHLAPKLQEKYHFCETKLKVKQLLWLKVLRQSD